MARISIVAFITFITMFHPQLAVDISPSTVAGLSDITVTMPDPNTVEDTVNDKWIEPHGASVQSDWAVGVTLNSASYGFHPTEVSSITIVVHLNCSLECDEFYAFGFGDRYISFAHDLDSALAVGPGDGGGLFIYPAVGSSSLGIGDPSSFFEGQASMDLVRSITDDNSFMTLMSPTSVGRNFPLTFTFTNDPINDEFTVTFTQETNYADGFSAVFNTAAPVCSDFTLFEIADPNDGTDHPVSYTVSSDNTGAVTTCALGNRINTTPLKYLRNRPWLHSIQSCGGDTNKNITEALEEIDFDETTSVDGYEIGWIKLIECTEGPFPSKPAQFTIRDGYTIDQIEDLLPYVISMRISPPGNNQTNADYTDFALETVACSNPVFAINNKKEMTWKVNPLTYKVDPSDYYLYSDNREAVYPAAQWKWNYQSSDWIGSSKAKERLRTEADCPFYLENGDPRDFPELYHSCRVNPDWKGYLRIDVNRNLCAWDQDYEVNQDMNVYFGFDRHKRSVCEPELDWINVTYSDNFIFVPRLLPGLESEMFCEQILNTSLAVVNTEQKKEEAFVLRYEAGYHDHNVRIGLIKPIFSTREWQWHRTPSEANSWYVFRHCFCMFSVELKPVLVTSST
eukprot:192741_1